MTVRNNRFAHAEDGAVTVDWVVLCAALVAFVIAVMSLMGSSSMSAVNASATSMQNMPTYGQ
ncbi:hypothetical protein [Citreimonas salinaria]|uniref:Flp pilus assembly protein, pilin Flp n=1 Tax=Citreimonas salinaria TaxID=321339 RepID=A0A1H3MI92_9RHOB|nr:hypothetical protein [Citreimonas salinaria]SDY76412.1 hypothetical protein SAMN05444340_11746 [Citreimonas salinaria]